MPKKEQIDIYCRAYLEGGGNQSRAYRQAFPQSKKWKPKTVHSRASEFHALREVSGRLAELQAESAEDHAITIEYLTNEYKEAIEMARELKNPTAFVGAVTALGKLHGLITDKKAIDVSHTIEPRPVSETDRFIIEALGCGEEGAHKEPVLN